MGEIPDRYLADAPPAGPVAGDRTDRPWDQLLRASPFHRVERIRVEYEVHDRIDVAGLIGFRYSLAHVLTRLGERRAAFEREVREALTDAEGRPWHYVRRDFAYLATKD